jgi:hypothetical protein
VNRVDLLSRRDAILEARHVRVDHRFVGVDREQQCDVHVDAIGGESPNRLGSFRRTGDFDHHVAAIDGRPEPRSLGDRCERVVGGSRRHFDRHEPVGAVGLFVYAGECVACGPYVLSSR